MSFMIKKICITVMMALCVQMTNAQVNVQRDYVQSDQKEKPAKEKVERENTFVYKFGVKAGVNLSSMSNNMDGIDPGFSMGTGFRVGGVANLRWGQRTENSLPGTGWLGLQPEIMYSYLQFGTNAEKLQFHTVQLPVMFKIYPTAQFSIEVGPEFTYFMSSSTDYMAVDGAQMKVGDIKGMTIGVGAGLAYDFDFGLIIGARYSFSPTKMAKNIDWKHSNIQVTLGWLF